MEETLRIPRHIAIIMDGNGRWARQQGKKRLWGHTHGVDAVRAAVKESVDLGVEYLTIYAFSTENWGRPKDEVEGLMQLLASVIAKETEPLAEKGVRMKFIGNRQALPAVLQQKMAWAEGFPVPELKMTLVIALNYSARWEITEAVRRIAGSGTPAEQITEQTVSDNLETAGIPDPDLMIRTSGEVRLSNFMLWQLSYSELYFTDIFWPDFDRQALRDAVKAFSERNRRWGKL